MSEILQLVFIIASLFFQAFVIGILFCGTCRRTAICDFYSYKSSFLGVANLCCKISPNTKVIVIMGLPICWASILQRHNVLLHPGILERSAWRCRYFLNSSQWSLKLKVHISIFESEWQRERVCVGGMIRLYVSPPPPEYFPYCPKSHRPLQRIWKKKVTIVKFAPPFLKFLPWALHIFLYI